ncbi:hypothetical protein D9615_002790 [Tricholomella constricta]|uniref:DASH complex subunit DAD1 n=1 Tax=Tricholomella constricta TaxID=117010 RepID=A0A8H5M635_9AGAR|nr:hypothetical protein D9615_002790 [Tricholomella constricta]
MLLQCSFTNRKFNADQYWHRPKFILHRVTKSLLISAHCHLFLARAAMSQSDEESAFFERERDRLSREITSGFEELLSSTNVLNRKLEEVLGMTKEYDTIAALWQSFYQLMRGPTTDDEDSGEQMPGLPGTGGHVVSMKQSKGPGAQ